MAGLAFYPASFCACFVCAFCVFIYSWAFLSYSSTLLFPLSLSLSSSCMRLSWLPCRCLRGPNTAQCLRPTWQPAHTRPPAARARKTETPHHQSPRYVWIRLSVCLCITLYYRMHLISRADSFCMY